LVLVWNILFVVEVLSHLPAFTGREQANLDELQMKGTGILQSSIDFGLFLLQEGTSTGGIQLRTCAGTVLLAAKQTHLNEFEAALRCAHEPDGIEGSKHSAEKLQRNDFDRKVNHLRAVDRFYVNRSSHPIPLLAAKTQKPRQFICIAGNWRLGLTRCISDPGHLCAQHKQQQRQQR
jgi:hypothetical protein